MEEAEFKDPVTGRSMMLPVLLGEKMGYYREVATPAELQLQTGQISPAEQAEAELEHAVSLLLGVLANPFDSLSDKQQDLLLKLADQMEHLPSDSDEGHDETASTPAAKPAGRAKKVPAAATPTTGTTSPTGQLADQTTGDVSATNQNANNDEGQK